MIEISLKMFIYLLTRFQNLIRAASTIDDFMFYKSKLPYNYIEASLFDFSSPVSMSDMSFWKFSLLNCNDIKVFIHQYSNILMSDKGEIIGRFIENNFVPLDQLENKDTIMLWHKYCREI